MIGTAFSILIRMELAAPGVQILNGDHQPFNVIITAHAFIMSTPFNRSFVDVDNSLELTIIVVGAVIFILLTQYSSLPGLLKPNKNNNAVVGYKMMNVLLRVPNKKQS